MKSALVSILAGGVSAALVSGLFWFGYVRGFNSALAMCLR